MSRTLEAPDRQPRLVAPTTTTKLAARMLIASRIVADQLPTGFHSTPALDILLKLHVAEEAAAYPSVDELSPAGELSARITGRWVDALVDAGLIDRRGDLLALSPAGHARVVDLLGAVYQAQRSLD